jgi:hypothetical protein
VELNSTPLAGKSCSDEEKRNDETKFASKKDFIPKKTRYFGSNNKGKDTERLTLSAFSFNAG